MLAEFLKDYLPIIVFLLVVLILSIAFVAVNYLASLKKVKDGIEIVAVETAEEVIKITLVKELKTVEWAEV